MLVTRFNQACKRPHNKASKLSTIWCAASACNVFVLFFGAALLTACSSSDDEDSQGYIKFYNAASDAPSIYMTLDENLDEDYEDEFEKTFPAVEYSKASPKIPLDVKSYYLELAWRDEGSIVRSDLEIVYEEQVLIQTDITKWVVLSDSIQAARVNVFDIPNISAADIKSDQDKDLFNLRFVNLHSTFTDIDVYLSDSDETFNEAILATGLQSYVLSENFKFDEDQYKLYITASGSPEVLFTSDEINYAFGGQYLISVRDNQGIGGSPFVVDNISNSSIVQYDALESVANVTVYNGLNTNKLLPSYRASIKLEIDGTTNIPTIAGLGYGQFSDSYQIESGDYRFTISNPIDNTVLLRNRALSMPQNANRTLFLYWTEEEVDDDADGNVDENDDGQVDEIRPIVSSLVMNNSDRSRLYDKELTLLNLINTDDFNTVSFYFVKANEIIETAENSRRVVQGKSSSLVLRNNTYQLFVVAIIDGNDIIIDERILILDETTTDQFLILEHSDESGSDYSVRVINQVSTDE